MDTVEYEEGWCIARDWFDGMHQSIILISYYLLVSSHLYAMQLLQITLRVVVSLFHCSMKMRHASLLTRPAQQL